MSSRNNPNRVASVLNILQESEVSLDVNSIRKAAGLLSWSTALSVLLELVVRGDVSAERTAKGWIFRARRRKPKRQGAKS